MTRILVILAVVSMLGAGAAEAQDLPDGIFATTKEGCEKLAKKTPAELGEALDFHVLSKTGFTGYQQRCDFVSVTARNATSWLANAFCEDTGYVYPDVFAIARTESGDLAVTRMTDSGQQEGPEEPGDEAAGLADDFDPSEVGRDEEAKPDSAPEEEAKAPDDASPDAFNTYVACGAAKQ